MAKQVTSLTAEQQARAPEWAAQWIAKGLSCEEAQWDDFLTGAQACYRFAGLEPFQRLVKVQSPLTVALAAPMAAYLLDTASHSKKGGDWRQAVREAVAFKSNGQPHLPHEWQIDNIVLAVEEAVGDLGPRAVTAEQLRQAIRDNWGHWLGGRWWLSWQAYTSFFRDVVGLELDGDLWERDRAYALAQQSVGWWWPHTAFVIASNAPTMIHREQVRESGWGSHRLHRADGPAIAWRDGWELYFWHGVQVTKQLIMAPETITREQVVGETNAEVRRCMIEKLGPERFAALLGAKPAQQDDYGVLYRIDRPEDSDLVLVKVKNSTPEPDGSFKDYVLRVHPELRPMGADGTLGKKQADTALNAIASTFGMTGKEYLLAQET